MATGSLPRSSIFLASGVNWAYAFIDKCAQSASNKASSGSVESVKQTQISASPECATRLPARVRKPFSLNRSRSAIPCLRAESFRSQLYPQVAMMCGGRIRPSRRMSSRSIYPKTSSFSTSFLLRCTQCAFPADACAGNETVRILYEFAAHLVRHSLMSDGTPMSS